MVYAAQIHARVAHILRWSIAYSRRNRQQNTRKAELADSGWFYSPSKFQVLLNNREF